MLKDEIIRAAVETGVPVELLEVEQALRMHDALEGKFSHERSNRPLWERAGFATGVHDASAWQWVGDFVGERECLLLFDPREEQAVFRLRNGVDLDRILENTFGFEFYLTDKTASYLVCFNHHDVLLVTSDATAWLQDHINRGGSPTFPRSK